MQLFFAKQTGSTELGSSYIILQDGPASFHVSLTNNEHKRDVVIYEHFQNPNSIEELYANIHLLENNLLKKVDFHTPQ